MRLSNMADYAVVVMGAAARHCGGARTSATALSDETGIALPTVQKLVSILTKGGLLRLGKLPIDIPAFPLHVLINVNGAEQYASSYGWMSCC